MERERRPRKRWTAAEDDLLRRCWPHRSQRARVLAALPHRTPGSITVRASQLHVESPGRNWSRAEYLALQAWGEVSPRTMKQRLPGRSWRSICLRARRLGLGSVPQGYVPLAEAARQLGYARATLRSILAAHGVKVLRWRGHRDTSGISSDGRNCHWQIVDLDAARLAIEDHLARPVETIRAGARARGVDYMELRARLLEADAYQVKQKRGGQHFILSGKLDSAAAGCRKAG